MATGRGMKLTGQTGEYLVAAEMCRRGLIATTFTGNVPHYDIIASDETGAHILVQVKTINKSTWQFDIKKFAEINFQGDKQIVGELKDEPYPNVIYIFVRLFEYGHDEFYIFTWSDLQKILVKGYRKYLMQKGGIRPRNPKSTHTAIKPEQLAQFRDNWDLINVVLDKSRKANRAW